MRHSVLAAAVLGLAFITTAASAAVLPPRIPQNTVSASTHDCDGSLDLLTVHKQDVMDVSFDNTIVIRPVCVDSQLDGNASGLRGIIGRNDAMAEALYEEDFRSDDVVGIQFGDDGVVLLYVMQ